MPDEWKWALSVLWSRTFVIDEGKAGLVPWVIVAHPHSFLSC